MLKKLWELLRKFSIKPKFKRLQYFKTWKISIIKFYSLDKPYKIQKNVRIQNCLLEKDLWISIWTFFYKVYIFIFNSKKSYWRNKKFHIQAVKGTRDSFNNCVRKIPYFVQEKLLYHIIWYIYLSSVLKLELQV